jgi:hypothetical protein
VSFISKAAVEEMTMGIVLVRRVDDAINRTELDAFRRVIKIYAFNAGVCVDHVDIIADAN